MKVQHEQGAFVCTCTCLYDVQTNSAMGGSEAVAMELDEEVQPIAQHNSEPSKRQQTDAQPLAVCAQVRSQHVVGCDHV